MKKFGILAATLVAAAGTMVGCGTSEADDDGIDTGVVVERHRRSVVVLEDDGERDSHSIRKRSRKCPVGSRWPDCKR